MIFTTPVTQKPASNHAFARICFGGKQDFPAKARPPGRRGVLSMSDKADAATRFCVGNLTARVSEGAPVQGSGNVVTVGVVWPGPPAMSGRRQRVRLKFIRLPNTEIYKYDRVNINLVRKYERKKNISEM
jgi:hypothetical protein